jgi:hypothetical protein
MSIVRRASNVRELPISDTLNITLITLKWGALL